MTDTERRILECIIEFKEEHDYPPSVRELGALVNRANATVKKALLNLEAEGFISTDNFKARTIRVLIQDEKYFNDTKEVKNIADIVRNTPPVFANGKKKVTPEQIARHLAKNGVILLPCKIGQTVWIVNRTMGKIYPAKFRLDDIENIGKRIFLTKAEAEKFLKGGKI